MTTTPSRHEYAARRADDPDYQLCDEALDELWAMEPLPDAADSGLWLAWWTDKPHQILNRAIVMITALQQRLAAQPRQ